MVIVAKNFYLNLMYYLYYLFNKTIFETQLYVN